METLPPYETLMCCWNTSQFGSSGHQQHNNGKAWPKLLFAVTSKMCVCPKVVPHIAAGNVTKHIKYVKYLVVYLVAYLRPLVLVCSA